MRARATSHCKHAAHRSFPVFPFVFLVCLRLRLLPVSHFDYTPVGSIRHSIWIEIVAAMARGKNIPQQQQQQLHGSRSNRPPQRSGGGPSPPATASATPSPQINRTRTKLPTKRKKLRQEAAAAAANVPTPQQRLEGELLVVMPRHRPPSFGQATPGKTSRGGTGGGRGGKSVNRRHPSKGILRSSN